MAELRIEQYPWVLKGYALYLTANDEPDMSVLSTSDRKALDAGFRLSRSLSFDARTAATHGPDWQAARLGRMRYEDMIEDTPSKSERVAYLEQAAPFMRL